MPRELPSLHDFRIQALPGQDFSVVNVVTKAVASDGSVTFVHRSLAVSPFHALSFVLAECCVRHAF